MSTRELVKVTGKSIAAFYERMTVGTRVECVENTYIPSRNGMAGTVTKPQRASIGFEVNGKGGYWMNKPERVGDVLELTSDSIKYRLAQREGHTATWRIVAPDHE